MSVNMKLFGFILLTVICTAQEPKPCVTPLQFEGRLFIHDGSNSFFETGKFSYDEEHKRFRLIEEIEVGSDKDYYDTLYLHNIGREYRLNLKTRQCNVTSMTRPFISYSVPPFAKFVFEAEIGATGVPGESLVAQIWEGTYEDGSKFETTVTVPDCVQIHHTFYSNASGRAVTDFFDQSIGISDPMVFIPPRECTT